MPVHHRIHRPKAAARVELFIRETLQIPACKAELLMPRPTVMVVLLIAEYPRAGMTMLDLVHLGCRVLTSVAVLSTQQLLMEEVPLVCIHLQWAVGVRRLKKEVCP